MEQTVIFTGDIYHTQSFPDPRLPFQGRNDKGELFMQPCLGECLHFSLISTPVASSVQGCSVSVGRQTPCRALPPCPDAVGPQEIISSRMVPFSSPQLDRALVLAIVPYFSFDLQRKFLLL